MFYNTLQPKYGNDIFFAYSSLRERKQIPNLKAFLQKGSLLKALDVFGRGAFYSIDKAEKKLKFKPKYNFETGMDLMEKWLLHISQIQKF
jgi:nucleoside-diphosphate-sugar epimerase